jgi:uncharacterized protein (TIGR00297 family)
LNQLLIGNTLAVLVSAAAYRARALSLDGAIAALAVGALTFTNGGWAAAAVLFAFFLPSTLLSRIGRARKHAIVDTGKTGPRDAWQVLANGGVAAGAIVLSSRYGTPWLAAYAGAFAAASADTWGTELGTLARGAPRSLLTMRPIATGLSGGVSWQGTLAECGGAAFVALVAQLVHVAPFLPVAIAGIAGATIDSVLGASAQALRYCSTCNRACETNPHICGAQTTLRRGFAWLENDAVNLAATTSGAIIAAIAASMLQPLR